MGNDLNAFWSASLETLLDVLGSSPEGLTCTEAARRLNTYDPNRVTDRQHRTVWSLLGAHRIAQQAVIVRRLAAIEDIGGMDVLCTDKTSTLTEGMVRVETAMDVMGQPSDIVLTYAGLNDALESDFSNPIDEAPTPPRHARP